jgi:hypothetical protein
MIPVDSGWVESLPERGSLTISIGGQQSLQLLE